MSTNISRILILIVCLAMLQGCAGCIGNQARFRETRNMSVAHVPDSAIRVETTNGGVTLQVGEGPEVQIEAKLACTTAERLAEAQIIADRVNGTLNVGVNWPGGRRENNEGCSFTITLPDASGVEVHTDNGSIKSSGLAGAARLGTSNGGITVVNHDGAVDAKSSNGWITVESATGDVTAGTSNGGIDVQGARRKVDASTSNGRVTVTLADTAPGPVQLRTSNGGIDLVIGSSFSGELKMSTSNGGLDVDRFTNAKSISIQKQSGNIVLGTGDAVSELRTSNGGIHVRSAAKP